MLDLQPATEDVFPADTSSVEAYLAQVQEMTLLAAIQARPAQQLPCPPARLPTRLPAPTTGQARPQQSRPPPGVAAVFYGRLTDWQQQCSAASAPAATLGGRHPSKEAPS